MACFIVPAAEAVLTTAAKIIVSRHEKKNNNENQICISEKISWLNKMLWGGSALLAFEHLWHGEIAPFFPFLTAMSDPEEKAEMLHEMAVSGTAMSLIVTFVWMFMVVISIISSRNSLPVSGTDMKGE